MRRTQNGGIDRRPILVEISSWPKNALSLNWIRRRWTQWGRWSGLWGRLRPRTRLRPSRRSKRKPGETKNDRFVKATRRRFLVHCPLPRQRPRNRKEAPEMAYFSRKQKSGSGRTE